MPTTTTGVFFVARQQPMQHEESGTFVLTLYLVDNQGPGRVEPYRVRWEGAAARAWWEQHRTGIRAGTPLQLTLHNPRSFPGMRAPETHATVAACELAPTAPSWHRAASNEQPPRAQPA